MATSPSSELLLRLPFINDVSLSATGREVALATRSGAIVGKLENQTSQSVRWWRVDKPELARSAFRLAFNPHRTSEHVLAVASSRSVSIVDIKADRGGEESVRGTVTRSLSTHLRPVNALDWSPHTPNLLATCGEDCRFFLWDVRQDQPAQALLSNSSWTAAVRWARLDESRLATGHEDSVCVWDTRNTSQHMSVLAPGQSRVLSVDWSHHDPQKLLSISAQQGTNATSSGSIKIWDLSSPRKVHDTIDIENSMPGAARFLPFGPAILAAVDSLVVIFSLQNGRKAQVLDKFPGHENAVSALGFTSCGNSDDNEFRLFSVSSAERMLRSWRYQLPEGLKATVQRGVTDLACPDSPKSSPQRTPLLSSGSGESAEQSSSLYLGMLAKQAHRLRRLDCVEEVASYREQGRTVPGRGEEYQLAVEVTTTNDIRPPIRLRITVGVDPSAPATRKAVCAAAATAPVSSPLGMSESMEPAHLPALGNGLRVAVEWHDEWKGTFDGPLAPGMIEETFSQVSITNLLSDDDEICKSIKVLVKMLERRDTAPLLEEPETPQPRKRRVRQTDVLPFPRSCGMCWSPKGDLLWFRSLQNVAIPFPRRWSLTDYTRVLNIHRKKDFRTLLDDENDEHSAAASRLCIDHSVHIVPSLHVGGLVEDNWWIHAILFFSFEPSPSASARDLCMNNSDAAQSLGRDDLAEVWRLLAVLTDELLGDSLLEDWPNLPFALRLVQQVFQQLYDAQETLTLALVGTILSCATHSARRSLTYSPHEFQGFPMGSHTPDQRANSTELLDSPLAFVPEAGQLSSYTWPWSGTNPAWSGTNPVGQSTSLRSSIFYPLTRESDKHSRSHGDLREGSWQQTPDSTMTEPCRSMLRSAMPASSTNKVREDRPSTPAVQSPKVLLRRSRPESPDLIPQDVPSMQRLLYSAHAHCDLMHRLGEFRLSRALAKLLQKLNQYHELPLLDVGTDGKFGNVSKLKSRGRPISPSSTPGSLAVGRTNSEELLGSPNSAFNAVPTVLGYGSVAACAVCNEKVRTLYTPCLSCGHGYHLSCFRKWFTSSDRKCPVIGCECRCLQHRPL